MILADCNWGQHLVAVFVGMLLMLLLFEFIGWIWKRP